MARDPLLARIQIGKKFLDMHDDDYRTMLHSCTGKRSAAGLSQDERLVVLEEMKRRGFQQSGGKNQRHRPKSDKAYVRKVFALWGELKRDGIWKEKGRQSLCNFVSAQTGVDDPEWLNFDQASKVIEALKDMQKRGNSPKLAAARKGVK
ncbi:gp16 family protein [Epibacterium ulvae]|uniref:gp16 family protein n=1 Tax=Epibacterium ulvae TaxID=1156985 RepID=UPI0024931763|nr:regulatory protein GemA [Epibacterium ulvae]